MMLLYYYYRIHTNERNFMNFSLLLINSLHVSCSSCYVENRRESKTLSGAAAKQLQPLPSLQSKQSRSCSHAILRQRNILLFCIVCRIEIPRFRIGATSAGRPYTPSLRACRHCSCNLSDRGSHLARSRAIASGAKANLLGQTPGSSPPYLARVQEAGAIAGQDLGRGGDAGGGGRIRRSDVLSPVLPVRRCRPGPLPPKGARAGSTQKQSERRGACGCRQGQ